MRKSTCSTAAGPDTFALSGDNSHAGSQHWHVDDVGQVSDQRLTSPAVSIPAEMSAVSFSFWNAQAIEQNNGVGCCDGGVLEIATDGGANFMRVASGNL